MNLEQIIGTILAITLSIITIWGVKYSFYPCKDGECK